MNKEQRIVVTVGVSGSGKSTLARDYVAQNPDTVIVSRDSVRMLLFGYTENDLDMYYKNPSLKENEETVTNFCDALIRKALRDGKDVVADNTHLRQPYINAYKNFGVKIFLQVMEFVTLEECLERDEVRAKKVGADVITKQWKNFQELMKRMDSIVKDLKAFNERVDYLWENAQQQKFDRKKRDCYIFDIDGTLAHKTGRSPHDYSRVGEDSLDASVATLAHIVADDPDAEVVIVSGRDGGCRDATTAWLEKHHMKYSALYMREAGDHRKDWMVKGEIWVEIQKEFNILGMIDDRAQVVDFARRLGYKVYQVHPGEF